MNSTFQKKKELNSSREPGGSADANTVFDLTDQTCFFLFSETLLLTQHNCKIVAGVCSCNSTVNTACVGEPCVPHPAGAVCESRPHARSRAARPVIDSKHFTRTGPGAARGMRGTRSLLGDLPKTRTGPNQERATPRRRPAMPPGRSEAARSNVRSGARLAWQRCPERGLVGRHSARRQLPRAVANRIGGQSAPVPAPACTAGRVRARPRLTLSRPRGYGIATSLGSESQVAITILPPPRPPRPLPPPRL